jgi:hypothetical protein
MKVHGVEPQNCVGVWFDKARAVTGKHSAVAAHIRQVAPDAEFVHCSVHRQAVTTKNGGHFKGSSDRNC